MVDIWCTGAALSRDEIIGVRVMVQPIIFSDFVGEGDGIYAFASYFLYTGASILCMCMHSARKIQGKRRLMYVSLAMYVHALIIEVFGSGHCEVRRNRLRRNRIRYT